MPQKIFFGDVIVKDTRTGRLQTINARIYKEHDSTTDQSRKAYVLKDIPIKERNYYNIVRFCFDTAKQKRETRFIKPTGQRSAVFEIEPLILILLETH